MHTFDSEGKRYYSWVFNDPKDLRCLYYLPNKGEFRLAIRGETGENNKEVLEEQDWTEDLSTLRNLKDTDLISCNSLGSGSNN